ncbi:hypothetical protein KCTC52924_02498 [Arenibacter antarcticus]|uniref:Uncharacterized protein n=1 Tax=Arenibacter antarcticus TaxID=2040469 RepID=A0ABW5VK75_9FLAO|nr:hypothetical protein [Arenibacter sp. H213]
MDYTIYIVLAVLGLVFFMSQGLTRKKKKNRKSKSFMEGYSKEDRKNDKES